MEKNKLFLSLLMLLTLSGCKNEKIEKINIERTLTKDFFDIDYEIFKEKILLDDDFIFYFYSPTCPNCQYLKENFFPSFLKKSYLKIYSVDVSGISSYDISFLYNISDKSAPYFGFNSNNDLYMNIPLITIVSDKKVSSYALGGNKINNSFFNKYIDLNINPINYLPKEEDKISLKSSSSSFITDYEDLEEGIIYHTASLEDNDEIKYYLKPLMEEKKFNIYLDVDKKNTFSSLEIIKNRESIMICKDKYSYPSLIDNYCLFIE